MSGGWAPNSTACTPAWWLDWGGCFGAPHCPPCSWSVPPDMPQAVGVVNPYYPFAPYAPPYPQYGWDNGCCAPPPPPYPVPYQMAPSQPVPDALYRPPCPLTYVGGACCAGCAEGGTCASTQAPVVGALGGLLGETGYPWSVAEDLNGQIEQLRSDLNKGLQAVLVNEPGGNATWADITASWSSFYPEWTAWYAAKKDSVASTLGLVGDNAKQLDDFVTRYNVILHKASDANATTLKPVDTSSPLAKGAEEAGAGIGKTVATAGLIVGPLLIGTAVVLGVLALAPYVAPLLKKRVAA